MGLAGEEQGALSQEEAEGVPEDWSHWEPWEAIEAQCCLPGVEAAVQDYDLEVLEGPIPFFHLRMEEGLQIVMSAGCLPSVSSGVAAAAEDQH